jgi:hypothetical protein
MQAASSWMTSEGCVCLQVVRTRNSASIYRPTCIANLVNAALWVTYGSVSGCPRPGAVSAMPLRTVLARPTVSSAVLQHHG